MTRALPARVRDRARARAVPAIRAALAAAALAAAGAAVPAAAGAPPVAAQEVPSHGHDAHARRMPGPRPDRLGAGPACPVREGGPGTLEVGAGRAWSSVSDALEAAGRDDTVRVHPGVYRERPRVRCGVTLLGREGAVLDGGGEGTVLRVEAPGARVRGLGIRGSGRSVSDEDSGILVEGAAGAVLEDNRLEDVLFGVYLKQSPGAVIRGNRIEGKDLPVNVRGDGIRLWYSAGGRIEDNHVRRTRDVVIWFSDSVAVARNDVRDGRYGLHYMYSDHNRFDDNDFRGNLVGAFLMYSSDLRFRGNVFRQSAGASGMGMGLKDADRIDARDNHVADNVIGIYLDNSPRSMGVENAFVGNRFVGNDVAIRILPSSTGNRFQGNDFVDNAREVEVPGGGRADANAWRGNHWSRYAGFDSDGDGVGDTPFVLSRLSDHLMSAHPRLRIFAFSPGAEALDVLARVLPFLEPRPVAVDPAPAVDRTAGVGGRP